MASITGIAGKFFAACESGKGWEVSKAYCKPDATFAAQAEPLADIHNLQQYTDWMQGLLTFIPDGRYELKSFATDDKRQSVCAYGVFLGTRTGAGGPCPPTGKRVQTDHVYVMEFDGDKIRHMTKNWYAGLGHAATRVGLQYRLWHYCARLSLSSIRGGRPSRAGAFDDAGGQLLGRRAEPPP